MNRLLGHTVAVTEERLTGTQKRIRDTQNAHAAQSVRVGTTTPQRIFDLTGEGKKLFVKMIGPDGAAQILSVHDLAHIAALSKKKHIQELTIEDIATARTIGYPSENSGSEFKWFDATNGEFGGNATSVSHEKNVGSFSLWKSSNVLDAPPPVVTGTSDFPGVRDKSSFALFKNKKAVPEWYLHSDDIAAKPTDRHRLEAASPSRFWDVCVYSGEALFLASLIYLCWPVASEAFGQLREKISERARSDALLTSAQQLAFDALQQTYRLTNPAITHIHKAGLYVLEFCRSTGHSVWRKIQAEHLRHEADARAEREHHSAPQFRAREAPPRDFDVDQLNDNKVHREPSPKNEIFHESYRRGSGRRSAPIKSTGLLLSESQLLDEPRANPESIENEQKRNVIEDRRAKPYSPWARHREVEWVADTNQTYLRSVSVNEKATHEKIRITNKPQLGSNEIAESLEKRAIGKGAAASRTTASRTPRGKTTGARALGKRPTETRRFGNGAHREGTHRK